MKRFFLAVLAAALVSAAFADSRSQIPLTMNYQGVLVDSGGEVVPDGIYSVSFSLYEADEGGSPVWTETQDVDVSKGIFSVVLGAATNLDIPFNTQYWLGVSVQSEPELAPRAPLTSTPYAFQALSVSGYTNFFPAEGKVGIGTAAPVERLDVNGAVRLGPSAGEYDGTIRWTGLDFEGYDGSVWRSLTAGGSGTLPPGGLGYTLRHDGAEWVTDTLLYNNGTNIGIGTNNPDSQHALHVAGLSRFETPAGLLSITTPQSCPGIIAYPGDGGHRRDIVFNSAGMYLSSSPSAAAPTAWTGLSVLENGRIGMGAVNPQEKLHIKEDGPAYAYLEAPSGNPSGIALGVAGTIEWRMLYNPNEGTLQMYKEGSGAKMVIGDGGRVGINTTTLGGIDMLEVHDTDPAFNDAAITGYSYFTGGTTINGAIGVAGIHTDDNVGGIGVYGEAYSAIPPGNSQVGVYGYSNDGYGVYSDGTLGSSGPIMSLAPTRDYGDREVYGVQSTGNWFEDFGTRRLNGKEATVTVDPIFAQTVNLDEAYHVFLTPLGDAGLYVAEKAADHFKVRARGRDGVDISFDYRIVARRRGHERKRLEAAKDPSGMIKGMQQKRRARMKRE